VEGHEAVGEVQDGHEVPGLTNHLGTPLFTKSCEFTHLEVSSAVSDSDRPGRSKIALSSIRALLYAFPLLLKPPPVRDAALPFPGLAPLVPRELIGREE